MTDATPPTANEPRKTAPKKKRAGGYLFIPKNLQKAGVILWLRRMHAWTGIYGAIFFFVLGLTGFYLNHRGEMRIENGATHEVAALSVIVEPGALTTQNELAAWTKQQYGISNEPARARTRPGANVMFDGQPAQAPEQITVSFRGPNAMISVSHEVGSNVVNVTRTNASLLRGLIDMHKVVGVNKLFILIMDTMAGAMIFMSISGILLWTRLHGPRLAAAGIMSVVVLATFLALSGVWVTWSA